MAERVTMVDGVAVYGRLAQARQRRQPEEDRKRAIFEWLCSVGVYAWEQNNSARYSPTLGAWIKRHGRGYLPGLADIGGEMPNGIILQIEVKTKDGKPTVDQFRHLERIRKGNGVAFVARSIDDVIRGLEAAGWVVRDGKLCKARGAGALRAPKEG
jgi:hypothetical protein